MRWQWWQVFVFLSWIWVLEILSCTSNHLDLVLMGGVWYQKLSGKAHCELEFKMPCGSFPSMEQTLSNLSNSFMLNLIVNLAVGIGFSSDNATDIRETSSPSYFLDLDIILLLLFHFEGLLGLPIGDLWFIFWSCWKHSVSSLSTTILKNRVLLIFLDWWTHMISTLTSPTNMWCNLYQKIDWIHFFFPTVNLYLSLLLLNKYLLHSVQIQ